MAILSEPETAVAPLNGLEHLPDRVSIPVQFCVESAQRDLAQLPDDWWIAHFVPQHYSGQWDIIPLRASAAAKHPILRIAPHPGISDWQDTDELAACPGIADILEQFLCPIGAARLMRLAPGSIIHEHRDVGLDAAAGTARLHIPLATGNGVQFRLNGSDVPMAVGDCWYLRLEDPHSVANHSNTRRIHLVFDATVNDWLAALLTKAAST